LKLTQQDLDLATQGLKRTSGARGVISNLFRVVTFRKPAWPALVSLSAADQGRVLDSLEHQRLQYLRVIEKIDSAKSAWPPLPEQ
ncbi:MAG: hypothetical protein AB1752_08235, partial [Candidatus Zixiibacteriota bacterium]